MRRVKFESRIINTGDGLQEIVYTRSQAEGAIPNGTLVEKCNSKPKEDAHADGAPAHVLGSIDAEEMGPTMDGERYAYFIEWLDKPNVPCAITGSRIREVQ